LRRTSQRFSRSSATGKDRRVACAPSAEAPAVLYSR
jgi:hypothetical protein